MAKDPREASHIYVGQIIETLETMEETLDWHVIDQVLKLIHDHQNIVFFGTQFSNSAAVHLQTDLLMLEKFTVAYMDSERQKESAKEMGKDDIAIIISVNGNYLYSGYKTLQYLKKSGCKIVLITCSDRDCLHIPVDYYIKLSNLKDGKSGKHALLTAIELMSLRYYTLYYPSSLNDLMGHMY